MALYLNKACCGIKKGKRVEERGQRGAHLLLLCSELYQHFRVYLKMPDGQHDGRGTGVMSSEQEIETRVLQHMRQLVRRNLQSSTRATLLWSMINIHGMLIVYIKHNSL